MQEERIICAAICNPEERDLTGDNALIYCGLRHAFILWQGKHVSKKQAHQGFLTSQNRFVNRLEAMEIAIKQGQVKEENLHNPRIGLFSEDLY